MFISFRKFFKKMFGTNKRNNTKTSKLNNISNNTNNLNNKDMLNIVIAGHYCSNDTLNEKVKDIIRIIGPDKNRQGYWLTQDGKSLNESIILDDYTLLSTESHEKGASFKGKGVNKKKSIMKGFKPIEIKDNNDDEYFEPKPRNNGNSPYEREIQKHLLPNAGFDNTESSKTNIEKQYQETIKIKDPLEETKNLISKASIESLNNNYEKKYGSTPYKPIEFEIPVKIIIPYELNKLSQICELFDIDTKTVAQIILQNIRLPEETIFNFIKQQLDNPNKQIEINQETNIPEPPKIKIQEQDEKLNNGIENIDNFISQMFNN